MKLKCRLHPMLWVIVAGMIMWSLVITVAEPSIGVVMLILSLMVSNAFFWLVIHGHLQVTMWEKDTENVKRALSRGLCPDCDGPVSRHPVNTAMMGCDKCNHSWGGYI